MRYKDGEKERERERGKSQRCIQREMEKKTNRCRESRKEKKGRNTEE